MHISLLCALMCIHVQYMPVAQEPWVCQVLAHPPQFAWNCTTLPNFQDTIIAHTLTQCQPTTWSTPIKNHLPTPLHVHTIPLFIVCACNLSQSSSELLGQLQSGVHCAILLHIFFKCVSHVPTCTFLSRASAESNLELLQKQQRELESENKKKKALVEQTLQER